ncbi:MAG: ABC transporter permease [Chthoniobacterales bacterium]|nr:ABC transporter permease [Chthoniobacterales bacterium]
MPNPLNFSAQRQHSSTISLLGSHVLHILDDLRQQLTFSGKLLKILLSAFICPNSIRWRETLLIFRKCGSDALLIVSLISLLMGMILAFQSAIPLRQFGVDIFVVNLVVLSILRELGVIMTAIVFAGRSASAFAAELGTMRINEEINALITLGLDPDRFLILPRILAGTLAVPILTIYANVIGILGGLFIVTTFGYSWPAVWNQALQAATLPDLFTGIIKSLAFGFLVSAAACLRGFQTQGGAIAVGISTTRSVVSSILLIIISDLLFALVFYSLEF